MKTNRIEILEKIEKEEILGLSINEVEKITDLKTMLSGGSNDYKKIASCGKCPSTYVKCPMECGGTKERGECCITCWNNALNDKDGRFNIAPYIKAIKRAKTNKNDIEKELGEETEEDINDKIVQAQMKSMFDSFVK